MTRKIKRKMVKWVLKNLYNRDNRQDRVILIGKRLMIKQTVWLHLSDHPWEKKREE